MKKIFLILVLILASNYAWADRIELKNGNIVLGKIIDRTQYDLRLDTGIGLPIYFYLEDIQSINKIAFSTANGSSLDFPVDNELEEEKAEINLPLNQEVSPQPLKVKPKRQITLYVEDNGVINLAPGSEKEDIEPFYPDDPSKGKNIDDLLSDLEKEMDKSAEVKMPKSIREQAKDVKKEVLSLGKAFKMFAKEIMFAELNFLKFIGKQIDIRMPGLYDFFYYPIKNTLVFYEVEGTPLLAKGILFYAGIVFYLTYCFPLMRLAKVFKTGNYWMAWVPLLQEILVVRMAGKTLWWLLFYLIPFVRLGGIVYLWSEIAYLLFKPKWAAFLMLIPGGNLLVLWNFSFFYQELREEQP